MVPTTHKTPAAIAAVITFLALVAGTATVPTAQASDGADAPLAARRVATKFKKIHWPASPATYATPAFVNGKIKSQKRKKRVVVLQQKLPGGWTKVDKDKTNGKGRFHLKAKTNWYHKKLKMRVVVQPTRRAAGNTSKGHGFSVNPTYVPAGSPSAWTRIAPGYKVQFNPCAPVRWKLNTKYAPAGVKPEVKAAFKQLSAATGIRFVYAGKTHAIPGTKLRWPGNTNMVVAWAAPRQTSWNLHGNTIGRGGQIRTANARTAKGKRAYQITRSGLVLDNTFAAPAGFVGPNARGSIIVHELGHVVGLGHTGDHNQQMYPSAENVWNGVYQAGDLNGMRHVGLMTGCLRRSGGHGRMLPSFVPEPLPVVIR
jgi:hypothetical protein